MPHVPQREQARYIDNLGYSIISHSGKIDDAPLRIRHLAREMLEAGFYAVHLETRDVLGPYSGSDAMVVGNVFHALLIEQLKAAGYALIYVRSDGTAEWDDLTFDGKLPRGGLVPGFYVISYTRKSDNYGPVSVAEDVLQEAALGLGWLLGFTIDDKIHQRNIQVAAGAIALDLYEFVAYLYTHAHEMLEFDGGDEIVRLQEWAANLEHVVQTVAETLDETMPG